LDIRNPGLILIYIILFILAYFYKAKQDQNALGGKIAYSKSLWLFYCIYSWFVIPFALISQGIENKFHIILLIFGISFWTRGIAELFMLYRTKNWKPEYGIFHNLLSFALLAVLTLIWRNELFFIQKLHLITLMISLSFETYYAIFFKKFIGSKTQGDQAIWFANNDEPIFKTNILITKIGNLVLFCELLYFIIFY